MSKYLVLFRNDPRKREKGLRTLATLYSHPVFVYEFDSRSDASALKDGNGDEVFRKVVPEKEAIKKSAKKKTRPTKMGVRRKTKDRVAGSAELVKMTGLSRRRQKVVDAVLKHFDGRESEYSPDEIPKKKPRKKVRPMKMGKRRSPRGK